MKLLLKNYAKCYVNLSSYWLQREVNCLQQQLSSVYAARTVILRIRFLDSEGVQHPVLNLMNLNSGRFAVGLGFGMSRDAELLPGHMSVEDVTEMKQMSKLCNRDKIQLLIVEFVYSSWHISNLDYKVLNDYMLVHNEMERIWKKAVIVLFKVLSQDLPGWAEENHRNLSQNH